MKTISVSVGSDKKRLHDYMTSRSEVVLAVGKNQKMAWKMIITIEKVRNQINRSGAKLEWIKLEIIDRNRQKFTMKNEIQSKLWLPFPFCFES